MCSETITVGLAQVAPASTSVAENARATAVTVAAAAQRGVRLLLHPEMSLLSYDLDALADPASWVTVDDPRLEVIRDACRMHGVTTVVGAAVRLPDGAPRLASITLSPDGAVDLSAKQFLHGAEHHLFRPGTPGPNLQIDGWSIALAVCFDIAVPRHAQAAADRGADVYAVSALYTLGQRRRLDVHCAARSMDHRMYTVMANFAGARPSWQACGGSGVWHPDGRCTVQAGSEPELRVATLSRTELHAHRLTDARARHLPATAVPDPGSQEKSAQNAP